MIFNQYRIQYVQPNNPSAVNKPSLSAVGRTSRPAEQSTGSATVRCIVMPTRPGAGILSLFDQRRNDELTAGLSTASTVMCN